MKLSIIIPAYNEEGSVKEVIDRVKAVKFKKEIIVVDDGSTDSTYNILKKIKGIKLIKHLINKGKGAAIRTALDHTTGDFIIIQDADLEYNPKDYQRLLEPVLKEGYSVVYGNRFPFYQGKRNLNYLGNKILSFCTMVIYINYIEDMETGYKLFKKEVLNGINLKAKGFDFEPEITAKIIKKGYKIKEVPINYNPRNKQEGKKITVLDGIKAALYLLKYRFMD